MTINKSLLTGIPDSLLPKSIKSIEKVDGGLNNYNILINQNYLLKKYLKQDEINDPVYLRFTREKDSLIGLKNSESTPLLLKFLDSSPNLFIVRNWVKGNTISTKLLKSDHKLLEHLIKSLKETHEYKFNTPGDFNYFDVIRRYLREYESISTNSNPDHSLFDKVDLPKHKTLYNYFSNHLELIRDSKINNFKVRIHGDLVFSNIIVTSKEHKVVFIDWEYSTRANPYVDLAYLVTQNPITKDLERKILKEYEVQSNFAIEEQSFSLYKNIMNLMSGLWFIIYAHRPSETNSNTSNKQLLQAQNALKLGKNRFEKLGLI
ncbi:MAG: phosphotransferase [Candidatus Hodarchaeales archaeon]